MKEIERMPTAKLDALKVAGHNMSPWENKNKIRQTPDFLSFFSRLNVEAAGILCRKGLTNTVVFSTGHTAGRDIPSEASAMKAYWLKKFPDLSHINIILEEESLDTTGNAIKCAEIAFIMDFNHVGLLTTRSHIGGFATLAQRHGLKGAKRFVAEDVYANHLKTKNVPEEEIKRFLNNCRDFDFLNGTYFLELGREILLDTVDPKGKLPNLITKFTRG